MTSSAHGKLAATREQELAHGCDLTVVTVSDPCLHVPRRTIADAVNRKFGYRPDHYDLLSFASLGPMVNDREWRAVLLEDIGTAVSLHGAEKLLVAGPDYRSTVDLHGLLHLEQHKGKLPRNLSIECQVTPPGATPPPGPVVLTCMDWRLHGQPALRDILRRDLGIKDYGLMTTPGVAKELRADGLRSALVIDQLERLARRGCLDHLLLLAHTDCGKYGGHGAFPDAEQESAAYVRDLGEARNYLGKLFPDLRITVATVAVEDDQPQGLSYVG